MGLTLVKSPVDRPSFPRPSWRSAVFVAFARAPANLQAVFDARLTAYSLLIYSSIGGAYSL